ncbi:MAG: efflux RND transporter periplasmic adaptor subunit [marine benthic group bacterium]|nr:efflux RND transporter periplasmic adaptor subunit [Gemmatimonadota bacterium]
MKRSYLYLIPMLALVAAACDRSEPGEVERTGAPQDVTVSPVARAAGSQMVPARVVAEEEARLATRASGTVRSVHADVGARVRPGQVLVRLDGAGVESAVAAAEASLTVASKTHQRLENLARDGAATDQEVDQARARLEMAKAQLAEARANRDYVVLKAPFAGTVTARYVDPGDLASPGQPVMIVSGSSGVKVVADAPAALAGRIEVGDRVRVLEPESGRHWPATVTRRVPVIEQMSNRFRLEAIFEDDATGTPLPGTYVRLAVAGIEQPGMLVPSDAVVREGQLTGVFTLEDGTLRLRWIRPGRTAEGIVEVLSGLSPDTRVVRDPSPNLLDGTQAGTVSERAWDPASAGEEVS